MAERGEHPVLVRVEDSIATVTLNRPDKLNALNREVLVALRSTVEELDWDKRVRVVVLEGAGRAFCSGIDLQELYRQAQSSEGLQEMWRLFNGVTDAIEKSVHPYIAKIQGACLGGAQMLPVCCDYSIVAEGTRLGVPAAALGIILGEDDFRRLMFTTGTMNTRKITIAGIKLTPEAALRTGLISEVVPVGKLDTATQHMAEELIARSPLAIAEAKRNIYRSLHNPSLVNPNRYDYPIPWAGSVDLKVGLDAFGRKCRPVFPGLWDKTEALVEIG